MKKSLMLFVLLIAIVGCTPTTDDTTLPTRVVLPTDAVGESATEAVIDPLESATEAVIDPLESSTEAVIDPLESSTEAVIDPLESSTEAVIDPLAVAPIVIPPQQNIPPNPAIPTQQGGLTVVMPTFDMGNLPTSVPTATPYPLTQNFANLRESSQVIRLIGTVEIFIEPVRDDDIVLLRGADGVAVELLWDITTIDNIPSRGQIIEAIGTLVISGAGHSTLQMNTTNIVPITAVDETDI